MSEFTAAVQSWIDLDGLVGTSPNPSLWSGGNQILDTSIACIMDVELGAPDKLFHVARREALSKCQNRDGSFDKNPGRTDALSHDDRLAMCAASRVCGYPFAKTWVDFGLAHDFMMSNTGQPYWDADARFKRWERAFHLLCASKWAGPLGMPLILLWVVFNGWFGDVSTNRLMWCCTRALKDYGFFTKRALGFWAREMTAKYGTPGDLMSAYLFNSKATRIYAEIHPFVVFGRKLKF